MLYRPNIALAEPLRFYRGGPLEATMYGDIVSAGRIQYLYVLEVTRSGAPCLHVASEVYVLGTAEMGPYALGLFTGDMHANLGLSDDWRNLDLFEAKALELVHQYLEVGLQREAVSPPPPQARPPYGDDSH